MILNKIRIKVIAGIALEEVGKIITIIITSVEMSHLIQMMNMNSGEILIISTIRLN
jgi:hypothetical protein